MELGGGSWNVSGLQDRGFSNEMREHAGIYQVEMLGYNYDELYEWAEKFKKKLLSYRRIKEVLINSEFSYWKDDYTEFYFDLNKERLGHKNILPIELFAAMNPILTKDKAIGTIAVDDNLENIKLTSKQSFEYDLWSLKHYPQSFAGKTYKLSDLASISKTYAPQKVSKKNQQYRLCLQYNYIGPMNQGMDILDDELKEINRMLPMGYSAADMDFSFDWGKKDSKQYLLLFLIIVIIFFTGSILFNSLKQPLAIIFVIPISYIGVFLTFYLFNLNFDQGGFAAFVLLCGITVNASIYILNEFNQIREAHPRLSPVKAYLKAWNLKIIPIFLTVISTMLGFIPFLIGSEKEAFWFPMAAGTIGGLIMSIAGIFIYLPLFSLKKENSIQGLNKGVKKVSPN